MECRSVVAFCLVCGNENSKSRKKWFPWPERCFFESCTVEVCFLFYFVSSPFYRCEKHQKEVEDSELSLTPVEKKVQKQILLSNSLESEELLRQRRLLLCLLFFFFSFLSNEVSGR